VLLILSGCAEAASAAEPAPVPSPPDPTWGAALPWSRFARVETLPGMQAIANLNDRKPDTCGIWSSGVEGGGEVAIKFPGPMEITEFRFLQQGGASKYRLTADLEGKGEFNTVINEQADAKPVVKRFIDVPVNKKVYGLKLAFLEGAATYRAPYPALGEVEIYSKAPAPPSVVAAAPRAVPLKAGAVKPLPPLVRKEIDIRLCIDVWYAGLPPGKDSGVLADNKTFQETLKRFKEADANSARLFVETCCCADEMPWKSQKLWPGHGADQLGPLAKAFHQNGIKLYFFSHAWMSPFQRRGQRAEMPYCRWDYPYEQSDRLVGVEDHYKVSYPCVISEPSFRNNWLQVLSEAIEQGADGVYLMPDEYFFKGHNLSRVNCPSCTAEFKKMFGFDSLPKGGGSTVTKVGGTSVVNRGKVDDTEQYRKWKLFEYRKIAGVFHSISAELRKRHPKTQIVMSDNKITEDLGGRLEHNMALDIIENDPNADFGQMYGNAVLDKVGWISAYCRRIAAAAGPEKMLASIQWLNVQDTPTDYPIQLFGYALPQIMLGAKVYENYRLNYMYDKGWWPNALECHKMIRLLEQWGVREAKTPDVACLIVSRASEDWWRTKLEGMCGAAQAPDVAFNLLYAGDDVNRSAPKTAGSERDRVLKLDAVRGVGAKLAMESFLCENAVPYKVAFAERPDNLQDLKRFKLLVMPFCYSLSKEAFARIQEAVEAGAVLAIFGPLGPTDEFGNPHAQALLEQLVGKPNVIHVKDNLAAVGNSALKRAEYARLLQPVLKPLGYEFHAGGLPVECIVRVLPQQKGYLVYLGNWDGKTAARPVISLPPLKGKVKIEVYNSADKTLTETTAAELTALAVDVAPAHVKLLRIHVE
jgi:hypothetical protein